MEPKTVAIKDLYIFVLAFFKSKHQYTNHLKLQKLLYYIQSWHLVYFNEHPLFENKPEAWVHGPVYKEVYQKFKFIKRYDKIELKDLIDDFDKSFDDIKNNLNLNDDQMEFLNSVLNHYGNMSHSQLVNMTHSEEPWKIARGNYGPFDRCSIEIEHKDMYNYYKNLN